jgi:hypothetical protein
MTEILEYKKVMEMTEEEQIAYIMKKSLEDENMVSDDEEPLWKGNELWFFKVFKVQLNRRSFSKFQSLKLKISRFE